MTSRPQVMAAWVVGVLAFLTLATANSGGYRYGASDQAYYIPAIQQHLTPGLFPRDQSLLAAQAHLMTSDELTAGLTTATGLSLPTISIGIYIVSLVVLLLAAAAFARGMAYSWWAVTVFGLLLTFRHRIARTGANSIEGYMHPRQLAFGIGVAALAMVVRGRHGLAFVLVAVSALLHPTTALWFAMVVGVSAYVSQPRWRPALASVAIIGALGAIWMVSVGPLSSRLVTMDGMWLSVLASKDYLFPAAWPIDAWLLNLAYPALILATWRYRVRRHLASEHEAGLVAGLLVLVVVFLISVPFTMADMALAVQLQVTRIFWVLDVVALAAIAWWLTRSRRVAIGAVAVLALASATRGYFLLEVSQPERELVRVDLPDTPWIDAMRWLRSQPADWHVLADPGHAWKYGVSVRLAAEKDTLLESVKDSALGLYDRDVALRVDDRTRAIADYDQLSTTQVQTLDAAYGIDVVIVEIAHPLDLPLLYKNSAFAIYDVR